MTHVNKLKMEYIVSGHQNMKEKEYIREETSLSDVYEELHIALHNNHRHHTSTSLHR